MCVCYFNLRFNCRRLLLDNGEYRGGIELGINNRVEVCSRASTQTNGMVALVANSFKFWLVLKPVSLWVAVRSRLRREW